MVQANGDYNLQYSKWYAYKDHGVSVILIQDQLNAEHAHPRPYQVCTKSTRIRAKINSTAPIWYVIRVLVITRWSKLSDLNCKFILHSLQALNNMGAGLNNVRLPLIMS